MTISEAKKVLGLKSEFSTDELKTNYRKRVLKYHPDRFNDNGIKFLQIQSAYQLLLHVKENPGFSPPRKNSKQSPYHEQTRKRQEAENAYKERIKHHVRTKKTKEQIRKERIDEFKLNFRYFVFTLMIFCAFFLSLLLAMSFGVVGVFVLIVICAIVLSRWNITNINL